MPEPTIIPFSVVPGTPVRVHVKDPEGKEWEIAAQIVVAAVKSLGTKDPVTGHSLFEFDLQVVAATKPMEGR